MFARDDEPIQSDGAIAVYVNGVEIDLPNEPFERDRKHRKTGRHVAEGARVDRRRAPQPVQ